MENRNYSTISPSAKALLLLKGYTKIPFARQVAELIKYPEKYEPDFKNRDYTFWLRVLHFENRYWSIDQLLSDVKATNILELSSGFSLRGLAMMQRNNIHYIDTDLPGIINTKKELTGSLQNVAINNKSNLELLPLNALDEEKFVKIVNHFPPGEIAIVNEGLLMYLPAEEKKKLCSIIHKVLEQRGGCWITADVYTKFKKKIPEFVMNDLGKDFFIKHNIEGNKFESFAAAKRFFEKEGFVVEQEAKMERDKLISFKYLRESLSLWQLLKLVFAKKMQTTWRLKVAR